MTPRGPRATRQQLKCFVEFLELNPGLVKGSYWTGYYQWKTKWDEIAQSINALGGASKDGLGWSKYLCYKKYAINRRAAILKRTGKSSLKPCFLESRLIALMEVDEKITGGLQIPNNPIANSEFPHMSSTEHQGAPEQPQPTYFMSDEQYRSPLIAEPAVQVLEYAPVPLYPFNHYISTGTLPSFNIPYTSAAANGTFAEIEALIAYGYRMGRIDYALQNITNHHLLQ